MNQEEKRVLRRKRHVIATNFIWNQSNLKLLKDEKMLTTSMQEQVQGESSNFGKMVKYMELLNTFSHKNIFAKLCAILDKEYSWISDELHAELRSEKGEIEVEEYINKETGILVMKEFGNSKRLSEMEKKDMHDLVAKRTQCTKEVWRRQLEKTQKELDAQQTINRSRDDKLKSMIEKVRGFLSIHKARLKGQGIGENSSTRQAASDEGEDKRPLVDVLNDLVGELRELTSQSLMERDNTLSEKERALNIINVKDTTCKVDKELEKAVDRMNQERKAAENEVNSRNQKIDSLNENIKTTKDDLEQEIGKKNKAIETQSAHLDTCHDRIKELGDEIDRLTRELDDTREELKEFRSKSMLLEKSRRLGYLHDKEKGTGKAEVNNKPRGKSAVAKKTQKKSTKSASVKN